MMSQHTRLPPTPSVHPAEMKLRRFGECADSRAKLSQRVAVVSVGRRAAQANVLSAARCVDLRGHHQSKISCAHCI